MFSDLSYSRVVLYILFNPHNKNLKSGETVHFEVGFSVSNCEDILNGQKVLLER